MSKEETKELATKIIEVDKDGKTQFIPASLLTVKAI